MTRRDDDDELDGYERQVGLRLHRAGLMNQPTVVEPCACGGEVRLVRRAWEELIAAMATHQASRQHVTWRKREGL